MSIDNEARVIHDELIHLVNPPHIQESVTREAMELARIEYEKFNGHDDHPQQENDSKPNRNIQIVSWDSIQIKKLLGTGGFAVVILAKVPELVAPKQQHSHDVLKRWNHSNTASTSNTTAPKTNGLFAIKCMNKESAYNPTQFIRAARDLFNEAILLSMLQHPNIIQLDGVSSLLYGDEEDDGKVRRTSSKKVNDGVSSSRMTITSSSIFQQPGGYFLVLQQLKGTLYEKLRCWRQMPSNTQPCIHYRLSKFALKISEAMEYIHSHQIIYRDLKPQNVGIDCDGNVRLFDFGLARKLRDGESSISGCTGSLRYMAPEVFDLKEASRSSDIFSFGIVLWEILALARPYHHREVGPGRHRRQARMKSFRILKNIFSPLDNRTYGQVHYQMLVLA